MVTIFLKGGLGNQMFQYAYGRAKSLDQKDQLTLDLSDLIFPLYLRKKETPRTFALNCFNIKAEIQTPKRNPLLKQVLRKVIEFTTRKDRAFQSENYFKRNERTIREDFTLIYPFGPQAEVIKQKITSSPDSVSLHIRRGDYVTDAPTAAHHGALPLSYYESALKEISARVKNATFFIFSDDIVWAKENLKVEGALFVSDALIKAEEELVLMSHCSHHIIANSSFSWWGAWLGTNKDKVVIAPKKWFTDSSIDTSEIIPENWIHI